jgi:hypothetical protein
MNLNARSILKLAREHNTAAVRTERLLRKDQTLWGALKQRNRNVSTNAAHTRHQEDLSLNAKLMEPSNKCNVTKESAGVWTKVVMNSVIREGEAVTQIVKQLTARIFELIAQTL